MQRTKASEVSNALDNDDALTFIEIIQEARLKQKFLKVALVLTEFDSIKMKLMNYGCKVKATIWH